MVYPQLFAPDGGDDVEDQRDPSQQDVGPRSNPHDPVSLPAAASNLMQLQQQLQGSAGMDELLSLLSSAQSAMNAPQPAPPAPPNNTNMLDARRAEELLAAAFAAANNNNASNPTPFGGGDLTDFSASMRRPSLGGTSNLAGGFQNGFNGQNFGMGGAASGGFAGMGMNPGVAGNNAAGGTGGGSFPFGGAASGVGGTGNSGPVGGLGNAEAMSGVLGGFNMAAFAAAASQQQPFNATQTGGTAATTPLMQQMGSAGQNPPLGWTPQNLQVPPFGQDPSFMHPKNPAMALATVAGHGLDYRDASNDFMAAQHLFPQAAANNLNFSYEPPKRRNSSLSSGSLSPVGRRKSISGSGTNNLQVPQQSLNALRFFPQQPPNLGGPNLGGLAAVDSAPSKPQKPKPTKKRAKTFPEKLMQAMMEYADEDAVAWLPDGKSFVIVNPELFCSHVLNRVFKESKYASFVRKLHRWGFVRLTSGTGTDCFHHPMFQRDRKDLAAKISCNNRGDAPKDAAKALSSALPRNEKPPSLAGVEKFIRSRARAMGGGDDSLKTDTV